MIKCCIVDDEPVAIEILSDYVNKTPFLEIAGSFRDALKALEFIQNKKVDLLFLDINMPDLSGIQLLGSLTDPPLVIFTTAYSRYAVESYEYKAVDYLLKPIQFNRFLKAANKAFELYNLKNENTVETGKEPVEFSGKDGMVFIKSGTEYHKTDIRDILYIEGTGNYITIVTKTKKILSLMTLQKVEQNLPQKSFIRIHRSFIVNINNIDVIQSDNVTVEKNELPIGEIYRKNLHTLFKKLGLSS